MKLFNYLVVFPSIVIVTISLIIAACISIAFLTSPSFSNTYSCIEHKYEWEQSTDDCDKLPEWQKLFCKERGDVA